MKSEKIIDLSYFFVALYTRFIYNRCILCVRCMYIMRKNEEKKMKKRVNITLEDEVIKRVDRYADEHYTSRSGAITMLIVDATSKRKESTPKKS